MVEDAIHVARAPRVRSLALELGRWRDLFIWFAVSRAIVIAASVGMHLVGHPLGYFGRPLLNQPLSALETWDGRWYGIVAERGYLLVPGRQSDPAFFPLFPAILRGLHELGLPVRTSGVVLANLLFFFALVALYELGRHLLPQPIAHRAAVYAAVFPMGFVFSMVYPESLVLGVIALAGWLAYRRRWAWAAAAAAVATLGRPEGMFLALPLAAIAYRQWRELGPRDRGFALAGVLAGPVTLVTFPLYLGFALHNPWAWQRAETAWGRSFRRTGIEESFYHLPRQLHANPWLLRDAIFVLVYLALLVAAWRIGVPRGWLAAAVLVVVLPLASGSVASEGRFGLLSLPVYWGLAWLGRLRPLDLALRIGSLALLALGTLSLPYVYP